MRMQLWGESYREHAGDSIRLSAEGLHLYWMAKATL